MHSKLLSLLSLYVFVQCDIVCLLFLRLPYNDMDYSYAKILTEKKELYEQWTATVPV